MDLWIHMGPRSASKHVQVFYAFFQGWRQRHGLPELDLNTKQQQLVSWRCQQVDFVGFLLFKVMFLTVMERCEFEIFCFFSRGKCTQKYPLKGKLMSKKQILN